jgi:hypothetical protein
VGCGTFSDREEFCWWCSHVVVVEVEVVLQVVVGDVCLASNASGWFDGSRYGTMVVLCVSVSDASRLGTISVVPMITHSIEVADVLVGRRKLTSLLTDLVIPRYGTLEGEPPVTSRCRTRIYSEVGSCRAAFYLVSPYIS